MEVDLGGFDALVAKPERDDAGVDPGVQEPHRGGVPQGVCGDRLAAQRGALLCCDLGVVGDAVLDRVTTQRLAAAGGEQWRAGSAAVFVEPCAQDRDGAGGERGDPIFATFAVTGDVRGIVKLSNQTRI